MTPMLSRQAPPVERALAAEDAPAETVDDADHRIEANRQSRHCAGMTLALKADRRDVQAELHDERDDIAEVAVFHVQRGDPQARPEAGQEGEQHEDRQDSDLPAGQEAVPDHQHQQDGEADEEIDEARPPRPPSGRSGAGNRPC